MAVKPGLTVRLVVPWLCMAFVPLPEEFKFERYPSLDGLACSGLASCRCWIALKNVPARIKSSGKN